ncbi:MAG: hypothetical protein IAI48_00630 [Candidatus Eremiobacteraeota bacterium]|nr:hypothetical protein [Candidatus Eremiobacteraeota bacterium]
MTAREVLDRGLAPIVGETGEMMRERLRREIRRDNFAQLAPEMLKARKFDPVTFTGALETAIEAEPFVPAEEGAK